MGGEVNGYSGFLLGVLVHAADIQDADSAWDLLKRIKGTRSPPLPLTV
jgi:hypothetical protein